MSKPRKRKAACRECAKLTRRLAEADRNFESLQEEYAALRNLESGDLAEIDRLNAEIERLRADYAKLASNALARTADLEVMTRERNEASRALAEYVNSFDLYRGCEEQRIAWLEERMARLSRKPRWKRWFGGSMITGVANRLRRWAEGK